MKSAIFKLDGGNRTLLCSKCHIIIKTGKDFTWEEEQASMGKLFMSRQYCNSCIEELIKKDINEIN